MTGRCRSRGIEPAANRNTPPPVPGATSRRRPGMDARNPARFHPVQAFASAVLGLGRIHRVHDLRIGSCLSSCQSSNGSNAGSGAPARLRRGNHAARRNHRRRARMPANWRRCGRDIFWRTDQTCRCAVAPRSLYPMTRCVWRRRSSVQNTIACSSRSSGARWDAFSNPINRLVAASRSMSPCSSGSGCRHSSPLPYSPSGRHVHGTAADGPGE